MSLEKSTKMLKHKSLQLSKTAKKEKLFKNDPHTPFQQTKIIIYTTIQYFMYIHSFYRRLFSYQFHTIARNRFVKL